MLWVWAMGWMGGLFFIGMGVMFVKAYACAGVLVALAFLIAGVGKIDAAAHGAYGFRIMVFPGVVMLWPLVLWRWRTLMKSAQPPEKKPRAAVSKLIAHAFLKSFGHAKNPAKRS